MPSRNTKYAVANQTTTGTQYKMVKPLFSLIRIPLNQNKTDSIKYLYTHDFSVSILRSSRKLIEHSLHPVKPTGNNKNTRDMFLSTMNKLVLLR